MATETATETAGRRTVTPAAWTAPLTVAPGRGGESGDEGGDDGSTVGGCAADVAFETASGGGTDGGVPCSLFCIPVSHVPGHDDDSNSVLGAAAAAAAPTAPTAQRR